MLDSKLGFIYIEDNPADVELFKLALNEAKLDCNLTVFEDGFETLTFIRKQGKYFGRIVPDLIVMELDLAGLSPEEILQALRSNKDFARVPVVILSSGFHSLSNRAMDQFQISLCISKPPDLDDFLRIGMVLKQFLIGRGTERWTDVTISSLAAHASAVSARGAKNGKTL
jgi:CheY-like chemotaxis protein